MAVRIGMCPMLLLSVSWLYYFFHLFSTNIMCRYIDWLTFFARAPPNAGERSLHCELKVLINAPGAKLRAGPSAYDTSEVITKKELDIQLAAVSHFVLVAVPCTVLLDFSCVCMTMLTITTPCANVLLTTWHHIYMAALVFQLEERMTKSCKALIDANTALIDVNTAATEDQLDRISTLVHNTQWAIRFAYFAAPLFRVFSPFSPHHQVKHDTQTIIY